MIMWFNVTLTHCCALKSLQYTHPLLSNSKITTNGVIERDCKCCHFSLWECRNSHFKYIIWGQCGWNQMQNYPCTYKCRTMKKGINTPWWNLNNYEICLSGLSNKSLKICAVSKNYSSTGESIFSCANW